MMEYLLNIHTATENALVVLSRGEEVIAVETNSDPRQHASFLHTAIQRILKHQGIKMQDIAGVGITLGPGSYTGIRVGLATAKGICFALNIPLIACNTLEVMALSAKMKFPEFKGYFAPMIDARRMEVFTAFYDHDLIEIMPPTAMILSQDVVNQFDIKKSWIFLGNGAEKVEKNFFQKSSKFFPDLEIVPEALVKWMNGKYRENKFDSIVQTEALYIKEFYGNSVK